MPLGGCEMDCQLSDRFEWHPIAKICPVTGFGLGLMLTGRCDFIYSHHPPFPHHLSSAWKKESLPFLRAL